MTTGFCLTKPESEKGFAQVLSPCSQSSMSLNYLTKAVMEQYLILLIFPRMTPKDTLAAIMRPACSSGAQRLCLTPEKGFR